MPSNTLPDKIIEGYLKDDVKVLNAQIPKKRRTLAELLNESKPQVTCSDGTEHTFRKSELQMLSQLLNEDERKKLYLPILMEVTSDRAEVTIRSREGIEATILSHILDMQITCREKTITIFRPQLSVVRKILKTTTQYVFFT